MTIADEVNPADIGEAEVPGDVHGESPEPKEEKKEDNGILSQKNLVEETAVPASEVSSGAALSLGTKPRAITITPEDKVAFIDSIVDNTRFQKDYSLFGGKLKVTIRSVTAEETNALAAWALKKSISDPTWHISGRGRNYLMAAQVARFNGMDIKPLQAPLFETLESDGKTVKEPGWINSASFWDDKNAAIVDAVMDCISDFDLRYSTLCKKAEDENFWAPDTP